MELNPSLLPNTITFRNTLVPSRLVVQELENYILNQGFKAMAGELVELLLLINGGTGKMRRAEVTVEELLVDKAVKEECTYENLPRRLQATVSSKEEWHKRVVQHCIKKRLQWSSCFAGKVSKENEYYDEMIPYLRKQLSLFPYHLSEYVCRVMRVSAFRYYCDMLFEVMRNEQPYDSIPNFSAADALRLTGIGRNEFIDIMNKCRSKDICGMWEVVERELQIIMENNFDLRKSLKDKGNFFDISNFMPLPRLIATVINSLSLSIPCAHQDLISKIQEFQSRPWQISIVLIDRTADGVADLLAKHAATSQQDLKEWVSPSFDISLLVDQEMLNSP
ncbi:hypothetical protein PIB30_082626 [Stylosanthes scabra]|uniref:FAM91 N-terminal domain-containing protein n=1 Tax=Stylosanthes scabra TaxID=79078 RepID=A0ABU6TRJ1_9FABA|nr:hypothetical protein [Stylosanthes scabra]